VGCPVHTTLRVYNILGQEIRTLVDEPKEAGSHTTRWDSLDMAGRSVSSGIYFIWMEAGSHTIVQKVLLSK